MKNFCKYRITRTGHASGVRDCSLGCLASEEILGGIADRSLDMSSQNDAVAHGSNWIFKLMNIRACFAFWWGFCFGNIASSSDV